MDTKKYTPAILAEARALVSKILEYRDLTDEEIDDLLDQAEVAEPDTKTKPAIRPDTAPSRPAPRPGTRPFRPGKISPGEEPRPKAEFDEDEELTA